MNIEEIGIRDYVQSKMDRFSGIIRPDRDVFKPTHRDLREQLNSAAIMLKVKGHLHLSIEALEECSDEALSGFIQDWLDKIWQKHVLLYLTAEEVRWWDLVMHFDGYREWNDEGPSREGRYRALSDAVDRLRSLDYLYSHSTGSDQYYRLNEKGQAAKEALQNASR